MFRVALPMVLRTAAATAAAALVLSSCSGGGSSSASAAGPAGPITGADGGCVSVSSAFSTIMFALQSATDGSGTPFDPDHISQAIEDAQLPASLQADFRTVNAAAQLAAGHSAAEAGTILGTSDVTRATSDITTWMRTHCH